MSFDMTSQNEKKCILGARNGYTRYFGSTQILKKKSKNGVKFACFNYINCIIGSGVVGMPFALKQAGFGAGILLLIGIAFITDYSLILMIECAHLSNSFTYQGLMEVAYGRTGFILLSILQFVYPFTAMISYNIIVGDTLPKVLTSLFDLSTNSMFVNRDFVIAVATLFVSIPLCLMRDLVGLARTSFLSIGLILFIMIALVERISPLSNVVPRSSDAYGFINADIFTAFGVMAFAFMCHHNVFLLYDSIENANQTKWNKITHVSVGISVIILCLFGIAGYVTFTGFTEGDIFQNYCWNDSLINVARLAFAFTVLFAFPIECMTARSVIKQLLLSQATISSEQHVVVTLVLIVLTYLISVTTSCLGVVLALNGIVSAIPLAFILPACIYIRLEEGPLTKKNKLNALCLAIFGCITVTVGSMTLFSHWSTYRNCNPMQKMLYCTDS